MRGALGAAAEAAGFLPISFQWFPCDKSVATARHGRGRAAAVPWGSTLHLIHKPHGVLEIDQHQQSGSGSV